jgi:hypothetical protein
MKVITIGSAVYLGEIEKGKGVVNLKNSMPVGSGDINKAHLIEYMKRKNTNKLDKPIEIEGAAVTTSVRDLTDDLQAELEILELRFKQAEKLAVPELINKKFDELSGR